MINAKCLEKRIHLFRFVVIHSPHGVRPPWKELAKQWNDEHPNVWEHHTPESMTVLYHKARRELAAM